MTVFYCDLDQIRAAGERYVAEGVQDPRFKAERQRDVDGCLVFLQSQQAEKLRVKPSPPSGDATDHRRTILP